MVQEHDCWRLVTVALVVPTRTAVAMYTFSSDANEKLMNPTIHVQSAALSTWIAHENTTSIESQCAVQCKDSSIIHCCWVVYEHVASGRIYSAVLSVDSSTIILLAAKLDLCLPITVPCIVALGLEPKTFDLSSIKLRQSHPQYNWQCIISFDYVLHTDV